MLQIILRNQIPGNNNLFRVSDTFTFVLKQTPNYKKKKTNADVFLLH